MALMVVNDLASGEEIIFQYGGNVSSLGEVMCNFVIHVYIASCLSVHPLFFSSVVCSESKSHPQELLQDSDPVNKKFKRQHSAARKADTQRHEEMNSSTTLQQEIRMECGDRVPGLGVIPAVRCENNEQCRM
jgi:hypothetical protein